MNMKSLPRLGGVLVVSLAIAAILVSQLALAQGRMRAARASDFIGTKRVRPSDSNFKSAAAIVLADVRPSIIGNKIDTDMNGSFVWSETIYNTTKGDNSWFTRTIFWFTGKPGDVGRPMTASEFALAETLFTDINLSRAKNLTVTENGIRGSVTAKEVGMRTNQLAQMTRRNLQQQAAHANEALRGIGE